MDGHCGPGHPGVSTRLWTVVDAGGGSRSMAFGALELCVHSKVDRRGRGWRVPVVPAQKRGRFARRSITVSTSGGGLRHGIQRRNSTFTARKHRNSAPHSTHSASVHLGSPLMIGRRIFAARLRASAFFDIARRRPRSPGYLRYRDIGGSSEFALVAVGSASKLPFRVLTTTRLAKLPAS